MPEALSTQFCQDKSGVCFLIAGKCRESSVEIHSYSYLASILRSSVYQYLISIQYPDRWNSQAQEYTYVALVKLPSSSVAVPPNSSTKNVGSRLVGKGKASEGCSMHDMQSRTGSRELMWAPNFQKDLD